MTRRVGTRRWRLPLGVVDADPDYGFTLRVPLPDVPAGEAVVEAWPAEPVPVRIIR